MGGPWQAAHFGYVGYGDPAAVIRPVSHTIALALFPTVPAATEAARALHALGISREHISVVARDHVQARSIATSWTPHLASNSRIHGWRDGSEN